jgi:hypothetical protein
MRLKSFEALKPDFFCVNMHAAMSYKVTEKIYINTKMAVDSKFNVDNLRTCYEIKYIESQSPNNF